MNLEEIAETIDKEKEWLTLDVKAGMAWVDAIEDHKLLRVYAREDDSWFEVPIESIITKIASYLKDKFDPQDFLKEILHTHTAPEDILEISERIDLEPKVSTAPRCFALMIGGKKGRPKEFTLVS